MDRPSDSEIDAALSRLHRVIQAEAGAQETGYFEHESRYRRSLRSIRELAPKGSAVLDVGSHFLHQAGALSLIGYDVVGLDAPAFAANEQMKRRAAEFGIRNFAVEQLELGEFLPGFENSFDVVVFCEIQEHIAFNPIRFWRRVYELLKVGGKIYLTTPNGVRVWQVASVLKRALLFRGTGLQVPDILQTVTYGHHWKEWSAAEIEELFTRLSPDFQVVTQHYQLRPFERWTGIKPTLRDIVRRTAALVPSLREELEVVVTLTGRTSWRATPPEYF
jgi:SAM-dependent methyltransferase